jgi:hypothetical protein
VAAWLDGSGGDSREPAPAVHTVALGATIVLAPRTRTAHCRLGPRPDPRCSPGAVYSGLTRAVLCAEGFSTSAVRNVPQAEKYAVEAEYGLPPGRYGRSLEIDHIVPLEIGGSNAIANLYPERGYDRKDRLENALHRLVCAGRMPLRVAQRRIASNWPALYADVFGAP